MRALILPWPSSASSPRQSRVRAPSVQTPPAKTPPTQTPPARSPRDCASCANARGAAARDRRRPRRRNAGRSLFEPTWQQFEVGGRFSSVSGDPARWQRYEDLGSGLLFTNARYQHEWEQSGQLFQATADNVGWRDQRFTGLLERPGRFRIAGSWDQIPSSTASTRRRPSPARAPSSSWTTRPSARSRTARPTRRRTCRKRCVSTCASGVTPASSTAKITPTPNIDLSTTFRTQNHDGELPWGASFGFSNDVEVALPYTSRDQRLQPRRRVEQLAQHVPRRV